MCWSFFLNETPRQHSNSLGLTGSRHLNKWTQELGTENKHAWVNLGSLFIAEMTKWWNIHNLKCHLTGERSSLQLNSGHSWFLWISALSLALVNCARYSSLPTFPQAPWVGDPHLKIKYSLYSEHRIPTVVLRKNAEFITMNYRLKNQPKGFPVRP